MLQTDQILQGRYRIVNTLGRGGMGAVYEARHVELDMVCVVKEMLSPEDAGLVEAQAKQFKREGKTLAGLQHPNLPRVWDYFTENGNFYLVMDLIRGQSLDKLIGFQGLPEATVLQYADQLLDVLGYVHAQGVLHRDIKPANIIIQPDGRAILVDFGLVKVVDGNVSSFSMRAMTPHYAPPEQYTGGTDARSDLYSLAATLYQAMGVQLPTSAADQFAGQPLMALRQLRPDVSTGTVKVIEKGLQLDRAKRYQNAVDMREALKNVTVKNAPPVKATPKPLPEKKPILVTTPPVSVDHPAQQKQKTAFPLTRQAVAGIASIVAIILVAVVVIAALAAQPVTPSVKSTTDPTHSVAAVIDTPLPRPSVTPAATRTVLPSATTVPTELPTITVAPTVRPAPTVTPISISTLIPLPKDSGGHYYLPVSPGVEIALVKISAGEFLMGSTDGDSQASGDEKPQHKVTLDEYLIGKYEVTNAQYAPYAKAKGLNWLIPKGEENHPVVNVSWDDAVAYCVWVSQVIGHNVMLPTEAQWEKAARGTDGRIYPWGNEAPDNTRANFNNGGTTPVGTYPKGISPYGLLDMAGNVWEWVADWYSDTYYASSPASNPQGPTTGQIHVVRGGGWNFSSNGLRVAGRYNPYNRLDFYGFRVVVTNLAP